MSIKSKESYLRKKAKKAGFEIHKGFVHYMHNGCVYTDQCGNRETGYSVTDLSTGFLVWGCYNNFYDNLWSLDDVETFLRNQYREYELEW
jgi:hypothetical protein